MSSKDITISQFTGGISPNKKVGREHSYRMARNLNTFEDSSEVTLMPKSVKISGTNVLGLPKWFSDGSPYETDKYSYDELGNLYSIDTSDNVSLIRAVSNSAGNGLCVFDNYLYYATNRGLGRYGKLNGTPVFNDNFLSDGTTNLDQSAETTGSTYTLPSSISEASANLKSFVPDKDPIQAVAVYVSSVGTGDWTLTIHDSDNNTIASETMNYTELTVSAYNSFEFGNAQGRVTTGNTYHFHLTSSDGTGTVRTTTSSDLSTVSFKEYFGVLVYENEFHPIIEFLNGVAIGNERYVAFWDQALYKPNVVVMAPGLYARDMEKINEYLVILAVNLNNDYGRLYFWDGQDNGGNNFNFFKELPRGRGHAICNYREQIVSMLGKKAVIHFGSEPFRPIQQLPQISRTKSVTILPSAVTTWNNLLAIGAAETDDGDTFEQGVYLFGSKTEDDPQVLSTLLTLSTGVTKSTTHAVGGLGSYGDDLYVGWKNGSDYGIDKVSLDGDAAESGSYESRMVDGGKAMKEKKSKSLTVSCEALPAGCSITLKYKKDRGSWQSLNTATEAAKRVSSELPSRFYEMEVGYDIASTQGNYPVITGINWGIDPLPGETNDQ
jgi:hypothetical protein